MPTQKTTPARRRPKGILLAASILLMLVLTGAARAQTQGAPDAAQEPKMSDLLKMPGRVIAESDAPRAAGRFNAKNYRVEEVTLPEAVSLEVKGKRVETSRAFRVTLIGGPFPVRAMPPVIWVDDVAVGYGIESEDLTEITVVTFDQALLREGATLYLSYGDKKNKEDRTAVPEKLKLGGAKGGNQ